MVWIGWLIFLTAAGQLMAATNFVAQPARAAVAAPSPDDPVEKEFQKLMAADDDAQAEVDRWIRDNDKFAAHGDGAPPEQLKERIRDRLDPVRKAYAAFLERHPEHARARVAYASFLSDFEGEEAAREQLEKALALDTNNPAIYNNLANIYGHSGPVKKAFDCYAKAIQLNPLEPVYYQNFGTTVFLFRKDAQEFYHLNEAQVFAKAFQLYSNAMRLDPENFVLASDVAQSYYVIQPLPTQQALTAWTNALRLAQDEAEREGVYIHFARLKLLARRFDEARAHLAVVTNEAYADVKRRLVRNLEEREAQATATNASPAR
jgi:tetratricopeptide (TPR) repeat protein